MLASAVNLGDVPHAIQLALAPVFLLTGIAGMLNVMAGRLARIIDRGRTLTEPAPPPQTEHSTTIEIELASLERRRYLASSAITACTFAALLVCTVIAALFIEVLLQVELKWLVGILFTGSTLALVIGLAYFLREVHLATQTVRITPAPSRH
jgi:MFS family permease